MITNWDILSRIDPATQNIRYTLVTDGTERDAQLLAKKLAGYVSAPTTALPPFNFSFELPMDLNEDTLSKIRTATEEGVAQINKVNQFAPDGALGDPLFNGKTDLSGSVSQVASEDSFFKPNPPAAPVPDNLEQHTVAMPKDEKPAAEQEPLTINDKDMLIKDMEGTMLDNMPLEDIFSAETKYDMFLDLENQKLVKNNQQQREQKINILADGKDSLEESFNVFEQKIKDQTCIIDLDDLNKVTGQISQKDTGFVKHANTVPPTPGIEAKTVAAPEVNADIDIPLQAAVRPEEPQNVQTENSAEEQPLPEIVAKPVPEIPAEPAPTEPVAAEVSPAKEETAPDPVDLLNKPADHPSVADPFENIEKSTVRPDDDEPLNLGPAPEEASVELAEPIHGQIPEEEHLLNTVPHAPVIEQATPPEDGEDLPEITIRGQKIDSLDKTFHLETTINTELMQNQYEKSFHQTVPPAAPKPRPEAPVQPQAPRPQQTAAPAAQTPFVPVKPGESIMEEHNAEKTTFRIRRKLNTEPATPAPAHTPVPHAPVAPVHPAPAMPQPRPQQPQVQQPVHQPKPAMPAPAAGKTILEKTKTIDHSIEIPLSEIKKHNWPLEVPLVPTYTLENMVMSVNRFAHATAISVIENPGKLYNPLVLHGATGTGKTHFLNAMAYAFSKKFGQENIFLTNGVRLSRGIQRYVMEGNIEKFDKFMGSVKVLLIDDIHLLAINEQNRVHISNLLNKFLREQKQIVITSKYPPESLEKLEELIRFRLDSGWISELKPAGGSAHLKIVKKMLLENGVDLNDAQVTDFFGGAHMTLGTVTRSIRRLKVLENLIFPNLPESERSQAAIFEKLLATNGEDATSEILTRDIESITTLSTVGNGEWGRIGFFYPQNSSHLMNWMVFCLEQRAKELGISGGFDIAVRSSYATENIISSAFKIANLCDNKKLKGAVILGPSLQVCDPSVRENFYDILTHMLEIMLIRCGIINYEDTKAPSTYVKVISELLR